MDFHDGGHLPDKSLQALKGRVVQCILFDLGDTLWFRNDIQTWERLEAISNQWAVRLLREKFHHQLLPDLDDRLLGEQFRRALDETVRHFMQNNPGIEANGPLSVLQVLQSWGIEESDLSFGMELFEALRIRIPESRPLFADTHATLTELQKRGFILGVVTNRLWGGIPFQEDMQTLGLFNYFDPHKLAVSADLGVRKPNPAIFLHALLALNVAPVHAVMVGDSLHADVVGALSLGIYAIWKPKARMLEQISMHSVSARASNLPGTIQENWQLPEPDPSIDSSPGMYATDDDALLARVQRSDNDLSEDEHNPIKPDLVIENLSELLEVFQEVGLQ